MIGQTRHPLTRRSIVALAVLPLITFCAAAADKPQQTIPDPGYRPDGYFTPGIVETLENAKLAVLPTLVRRTERTAHSFASQQQIVAYLNDRGIEASVKPRRIDLGSLRRPSQWEIFQYGADRIAEAIREFETGTDYVLVMEILIPDYQAVFGIEVYIVDQDGAHVLSFLLNAHHEIFTDARLVARNSSEAARGEMIAKATAVGLTAFTRQLQQLRDCVDERAASPTMSEPGTLHDFQLPLASGEDHHGTALGFSTFGDGNSTVTIATTGDLPHRSGAQGGNKALRLDLNVQAWAGSVELFADSDMRNWVPRNWSQLEGFSFWLYGTNSGADMFVDILDNRHPCSTRDDAERYTYRFVDDVSGWRQILIPFEDMGRKEISNGAPNDGLDLQTVHGWGLGTLATAGPIVFYIDDVRLESRAEGAEERFNNATKHRLFLELPVDETRSWILLHTGQQQGLVVEKALDLMCEVSRLTIERGYRYFRIDQRALLSGNRAVFRLTMYQDQPEDITIIGLRPDPDTTAPSALSAAFDAEGYYTQCKMIDRQAH